MDATLKAAFEVAARNEFPEIDLTITSAGYYRNNTTFNQYEAFLWGVQYGSKEKANG